MKVPTMQQTTPTPWGRIVWHHIGSGPPLVLLHGGGGSWTHWQRCSPLLAETHNVLMPDMPGFGASDLPPGDSDPEIIARALLHGLDTVIGPETRFFLTGFSFGGLVAGLMARNAGDRVRVLVLVGPSGLGLPT
jgi:2-hydroxy-6-oxonona-2,4-dienedioate hydrolase